MHNIYLDRYGSLQLPRHILEKLEVQQKIAISEEDGKIILSQNGDSVQTKKVKKE